MRRLAALFLSAAALAPKAPTPPPPPTLTSEAYRVASAFDKKLSVWYASYYYGLGTAYRRTGEAFLGAVLALYGGAARRCVAFGLPAAAAARALPRCGSEATAAAVWVAAAAAAGHRATPRYALAGLAARRGARAVLRRPLRLPAAAAPRGRRRGRRRRAKAAAAAAAAPRGDARGLAACAAAAACGVAALLHPLDCAAVLVHVAGAKMLLSALSALCSLHLAGRYSFSLESYRYAAVCARLAYEKAYVALHRLRRRAAARPPRRRGPAVPGRRLVAALRAAARRDEPYAPPVLRAALERLGRLVRDTSHWTLGVACFAKRRRPPRALRAALAPVLALEADLAALGR